MAGYQFIHYEAYARQGNKKKRSIISIAEEADRASGSYPHVITSLLPQYLLGESFVNVAKLIVAAAGESRINHGGKRRKLRKDANVGIGLIASHPTPLNQLYALSGSDRKCVIDEVMSWAERVITFSQLEFPGQVQVAALHWDESHPHLHILIGNTEPTDDFQILHKGELARKKAQGNDRTGKGKKIGNDAYTREMRRFQDSFHSEVSLHHGQTRLGPKRRRLSRSEWCKEQAQAEALANSKVKAEIAQHKIESDLAEALLKAQSIVDLSLEEASFQAKKIDQDRQIAKRERHEAEALKRKADVEARKVAELKQQAVLVKKTLNNHMRKLYLNGSLFSRAMGWFGVRKRIERNTSEKLKKQLVSLRKQVDTLSAEMARNGAIKQKHDHALGALKAIKTAFSMSVMDCLAFKDNGKSLGHFEHIQALIEMNLPANRLEDELNVLIDSIKLDQYHAESQHQPSSNLVIDTRH